MAATTWLIPPTPSGAPSWKREDDEDSSVGRSVTEGGAGGFERRSDARPGCRSRDFDFRRGIRLPPRSPKGARREGATRVHAAHGAPRGPRA
jgi:hypothetical protein